MRTLVTASALGVLLFHGEAHAQKLLENEHVIVWRLPSGAPAQRLEPARRPGLVVDLSDATVRAADDVTTATSPGTIVVALKEHRSPTLATPRGLAPAFPRDGATRLIENDRVAVWDVRWTTGAKTPMHFHDKDVVAIYLSAGTVRSIPPSGAPTATPRTAGEVVFLARGRTHVEECVAGPRRDVIIELK